MTAPADTGLTTADFDFHLPEELIALRPASPRGAARLLVVPPADAPFVDAAVRDLPRFLEAGDLLVFNDTRVLPVRLTGTRTRGEAVAHIEATLIERLGPARWRALVRPAKRLKAGETVVFAGEGPARLAATVEDVHGEGAFTLALAVEEADEMAALEAVGAMPLPPYIAGRRPADARDAEDYQTVYARREGSVAAPTAGLHFTPALFEALEAAGVERTFVTLHVGAGTFLPVKVERIADHRMHAEYGEVPPAAVDAIAAARARGRRVVAVGTTAMRLLESAADPATGAVAPFAAETDIFISPGYRFRAVDALMTNFHLPRSTLMMLVSAFSGMERMRAAYAHAIARRYRFFSYGDSSLLFPAEPSLARTHGG